MLSADSDSEAIEAYQEAKQLFSSALMNLWQFLSNSPGVTENIDEKDRYPNSSMRVLDIEWCIDDDTLLFGTVPMPQVDFRNGNYFGLSLCILIHSDSTVVSCFH